MDTPLAANIINLVVGVSTFLAVVVALGGIWLNRKQAREDWLHSQQLATDERQHQSRPIVVPVNEISHNTVTYYSLETKTVNESLYTSEHRISWIWPHPIRLTVRNMGSGPAFNLQCVLYGPENICQSQFVSWDGGPIEEKSPVEIKLVHSSDLQLFHSDSVDGKHPLYDKSLDSPSNPWIYRIACLTITYQDLFEVKHVSIFNYTLEHRWIHVATEKIPVKPPLDLKELNDRKKQGPKLSAPPIMTAN